MKFKLNDNLRYSLYAVLYAVLSSTFLGFALIFISIEIFGKTEFLSWQMFAQIVMVALGGALIGNKRD